MKLQTVKKFWDEYREHVVPKDAHKNQIIETRRAFYAAFTAALETIKRIGFDDISEDEGVKHLESMFDEVNAFAQTIGTDREGE